MRPGREGCRLHGAPAGPGGGGAGAAEPHGPPAPHLGDLAAPGRRARAGADWRGLRGLVIRSGVGGVKDVRVFLVLGYVGVVQVSDEGLLPGAAPVVLGAPEHHPPAPRPADLLWRTGFSWFLV